MPNPKGNFQTLKPYESKWRSGKTQTIRCAECGYHEHADIGAAKTIRDRALEMVRGTLALPGTMDLNAHKISPRSKSKRSDFGNPRKTGY